jgi:flagellar secretion chaperone FliS
VNAATRAAEAYRRVESESRSPLELVVMLYDGALRFLGEAADAATRGDIRARSHAISRTLAIIAELQNTLDLENGGAIAEQLDDLYTYITSRLLDVALKQDLTAVEESRRLLAPIRDAWSQISTPDPAAV